MPTWSVFHPDTPSLQSAGQIWAKFCIHLVGTKKLLNSFALPWPQIRPYILPVTPSIAKVQSNLALVLLEVGQSVEAAELLCDTLAADLENYPPGDIGIAVSQANFGMALLALRLPSKGRAPCPASLRHLPRRLRRCPPVYENVQRAPGFVRRGVDQVAR